LKLESATNNNLILLFSIKLTAPNSISFTNFPNYRCRVLAFLSRRLWLDLFKLCYHVRCSSANKRWQRCGCNWYTLCRSRSRRWRRSRCWRRRRLRQQKQIFVLGLGQYAPLRYGGNRRIWVRNTENGIRNTPALMT